MKSFWPALSHDPALRTAVKQAVIIFVVLRLFLSVWAVVSLAVSPIPAEADEAVRPYLGQPILNTGIAGLVLGPWQRFDTLHYTRIASQGYAYAADSVFPPLYPLAIWLVGALFGGHHAAHLLAGILLANTAFIGLLILLHRVVAAEIGAENATRTLIYLVLFPVGFFLLTPYTESIFMLFALGSVWAARNGRFPLAGILGLLASMTRLTGWVLVAPLAYEYWRRHMGGGKWKINHTSWSWHQLGRLLSLFLPLAGSVLFVAYRWAIGLPSLTAVYAEYWYQETGIPGVDLWRALNTMFLGGEARMGEFTLWFDFACTILLIVTTIIAFRRLGMTWGLFSAMLLLFILLPTSDLKPLYSFSRYTLAFFPTFMLLGIAGKRPLINRLILYPSIALYFYFSGQFIIWGWVA